MARLGHAAWRGWLPGPTPVPPVPGTVPGWRPRRYRRAAVRRLHPIPEAEVDPWDACWAVVRTPLADRPWVLTNAVVSLDGAWAVGGRSAPLGSPADQRMLAALRSVADVVLVGAGTVRAEGYGPPRRPPESVVERRRSAGQADRPRLAVVSASLDFGGAVAWLDDDPPPVVITVADAAPDRVARLGTRARVIHAGHGRVDLTGALGTLRHEGTAIVTCEGGPRLFGELVAADLVDEWCETLSPALVGGAPGRVVSGAPEALRSMRLTDVLVDGDHLFLRHLRADPAR